MSLDVGSIKGKKPLVDIINKYKIPLVAISLIHYIGTKKYELFSWYNNPSKSDSTIANNISALIRHFSAHRSGCLFDDESHLPHMFHMVCRCAMMITILYKEHLQDYTVHDIKNGLRLCDDPFVGCMLTGEELISLSKELPCEMKYSHNELEIAISNKLVNFALFYDKIKLPEDMLNEICDFDILFRLICEYVSQYWNDNKINIQEHFKYNELDETALEIINIIKGQNNE